MGPGDVFIGSDQYTRTSCKQGPDDIGSFFTAKVSFIPRGGTVQGLVGVDSQIGVSVFGFGAVKPESVGTFFILIYGLVDQFILKYFLSNSPLSKTQRVVIAHREIFFLG